MTTWILVLTLASYRGGVAIHSIPGFAEKASCMAAAAAFLSMPKPDGYSDAHQTALCVEQKK